MELLSDHQPMTNRVALVTGAGRGIGRETARLLATLGAKVMAVSRTEKEVAQLAQEAGVEYVAESVTSQAGRARILEETHRRLGPVDVLVNNAGIFSPQEREIWKAEPAVWYEVVDVNLNAPFELTRLVLPDMIERRWGRIVMVSSDAALPSGIGPGMCAYAASKTGLVGLARVVALDAAPFNVTCNSVLPGWVRTRMAEESAEREAELRSISVDEIWNERVREYRAGRVVTIAEVAHTIAFLAGENASGISGAEITVALGN